MECQATSLSMPHVPELKEGVVSSEGTPTPSAVTGEEGHRKDEEMSADSSASIASNRSANESSEAR